MRHCCKIHDLLHIVGTEHDKSCLPAAHYIGMVSEYRKSMCGECSGCHVEDGGSLFARKLIHVGNHEKKTL